MGDAIFRQFNGFDQAGTPVGTATTSDSNDRPISCLFTDDGSFLFVATTYSFEVTEYDVYLFAWDSSNGTFTQTDTDYMGWGGFSVEVFSLGNADYMGCTSYSDTTLGAYVYNITNPSNITKTYWDSGVVCGVTNEGRSTPSRQCAVNVGGSLVFIASRSACMLVDFSNPAAPSIIWSDTSVGVSGLGGLHTTQVYNGFIYVGCQSDGLGTTIAAKIDVTGGPKNITTIDLPALKTINAAFASPLNNRIYAQINGYWHTYGTDWSGSAPTFMGKFDPVASPDWQVPQYNPQETGAFIPNACIATHWWTDGTLSVLGWMAPDADGVWGFTQGLHSDLLAVDDIL